MSGIPGNVAGASPSAPVYLRHSHGLEQFFARLAEGDGLQVLDLGEFTQSNVSYITGLGHRLYSEDFLHALDSVFEAGDPRSVQADAAKTRIFLDQVLQFPPGQFDAVLVWNVLEQLSTPLLKVVMERLHTMLRPGGALFACFHAESKDPELPQFSYRIADSRTLQLRLKGRRLPAQTFNNRAIERLFEKFHSVKFFLTRDHLREVIVRR